MPLSASRTVNKITRALCECDAPSGQQATGARDEVAFTNYISMSMISRALVAAIFLGASRPGMARPAEHRQAACSGRVGDNHRGIDAGRYSIHRLVDRAGLSPRNRRTDDVSCHPLSHTWAALVSLSSFHRRRIAMAPARKVKACPTADIVPE